MSNSPDEALPRGAGPGQGTDASGFSGMCRDADRSVLGNPGEQPPYHKLSGTPRRGAPKGENEESSSPVKQMEQA
ncbi:MAG: hypothetical protein EHM90_02195 [Chloroflexi bacterium]|nr:MAG: hypothetical protein EHM90_02195 [Chloroflexota bacterium]